MQLEENRLETGLSMRNTCKNSQTVCTHAEIRWWKCYDMLKEK
jgi:hypothetical protein